MLPSIAVVQKLRYQAQSGTFANVFDGIETPSGIAKQTMDLFSLNLDAEPTAGLRTILTAVFEKIGYVFFANDAKAVP